MTNALERAVNALSDPAVSTANALRSLLVVVRRIGATNLAEWIGHELSGYGSQDQVPPYRSQGMPIALHFNGPFQSSRTMHVTAAELPAHLAAAAENNYLTVPVAELQALAEAGGDPERGLPARWIGAYREAVDAGTAPGIEMMVLNRAGFLVPRTYLRDLLDQIKTTALELALELEDISPDLGEASGPTVAGSPELAAKVGGFHMQIMGENNIVIFGDGNAAAAGRKARAIALQVGDVESLLAAARDYVDEDAVAALAEAIKDDGHTGGEKTRTWLETVKRGGYGLVGGMVTNGAYDGLQELLLSVFPHMFGG